MACRPSRSEPFEVTAIGLTEGSQLRTAHSLVCYPFPTSKIPCLKQ